MTGPPRVPWSRVLARRARRHFLAGEPAGTAAEVSARLVGVQAQVLSAAEQAVAVRGPRSSTVRSGLADGALVRTWSARGTLHVHDAAAAPSLLAVVAAARSWEKGAWQREFASATEIARLAELVGDLLRDASPTREELVAALAPHISSELAGRLTSGWGTVLKPLAWQGLLVHGALREGRTTFTAPPWRSLPDADGAAHTVIPAYLDAHGPASPEGFDDWLLRGATPRPTLRRWFAELTEAGVLTPIVVHPDDDSASGQTRYARTVDLDELHRDPTTGRRADADAADGLIRFLPPFDPWVLGPGTKEVAVVRAEHRRLVSRAAGWIAPVVIRSGRVVGTWSGRAVEEFDLFDGEPDLPAPAVARARARWEAVLAAP